MTHKYQYLLWRLHEAGISLSVKDDRLVCDGKKGALTPELKNALGEAKDDLLRAFHKRADFLKQDIGMPADESDAWAAEDTLLPDTTMYEESGSSQAFRNAMSDAIDENAADATADAAQVFRVRYARKTRDHLALSPRAKDDSVYVLVLGEWPHMWDAAWILGRDAKQHKWLTVHEGKLVHLIPRNALRPMAELKGG